MRDDTNNVFYYNEEKLSFIIDYLKLDVKDIADVFGTKSNYISKLRDQMHNTLKPMHLHAFSHAFNVPYRIFEDRNINSSEKIRAVLEAKEASDNKTIFKKNEQLIKDIQGDWYAYFYPSNRFANVYCIKTTITKNAEVIDANNNVGKLLIGKNQSMIVKEAFNSKNLISIIFDNHQVAYNMFHFSLVSKRNHVNREMLNFGFFSRKEIEPDLAKEILGEKKYLQLKMQCDFVERISEYVEVIG
ncbi:MAG: Unknown protein [uncultured Sulfurovum sp.]|uniref:Uncharacterized protein n=1 Tax=uncultured Sulfurovum sp. TaxID=269237 RepID=A0A6S6T194_9BACT|nr:MAG: Unknown protein [uncultured Sulfurovum sp.]